MCEQSSGQPQQLRLWQEALDLALQGDRYAAFPVLVKQQAEQVELKRLMQLVLRDPQAVFPAFTLTSTHPLHGMLADRPVIPTVNGAPSLLLYDLHYQHVLPQDQLKPATQSFVEEVLAVNQPVKALVSASGLGPNPQQTSMHARSRSASGCR